MWYWPSGNHITSRRFSDSFGASGSSLYITVPVRMNL